MLLQRLDGVTYLAFLQDALPDLLEDVPLATRQQMWFQHDGAPGHFALPVRTFLNEHFPQQLIGRGGPVAWPARSPDLNLLDFFLWGHLKSLVYENAVNSEEDLVARIHAATEHIRATPAVFQDVRESLVRRCRMCIQVEGRHFEQLI